MSSYRPRLTRRAASRMLDDPHPGADSLSTVLAAASAPGEPTELSREELVLAQFRAGAALALVPPETTSVLSRVRKLVAAPAVAFSAAGLVLTGGGLAIAASQGALHVPFTGHDNRPDDAPSAPTSTNPGIDRTDVPGSGKPSDLPTSSQSPGATPSPSLEGLCRAFQAGAAEVNHENPAFAALVAAAGGEENLTTYCVDLVGPPKKPTTPVTPTRPAKPTQAATPTPGGAATTPSKPTQAATPSPRAPSTLPTPTARPAPPAH